MGLACMRQVEDGIDMSDFADCPAHAPRAQLPVANAPGARSLKNNPRFLGLIALHLLGLKRVTLAPQ